MVKRVSPLVPVGAIVGNVLWYKQAGSCKAKGKGLELCGGGNVRHVSAFNMVACPCFQPWVVVMGLMMSPCAA